GGVVLMGYSSSTDGDLAEVPHAGQWDVWILKLAPWSGTGVEDPADENSILLFPNPTTGDLQLDFGSLHGPGWQLEIMDALGRMVLTMPQVHATRGRLTIGTHGLAQGSYAVRLHRDGESHVKRLIKQ
ncbi:MAG: T9SS type A sorting domain-containing protein, partial [Flavobacteriales bacterium]|nr:T9SS type A sorting domain-containing protein [Flavobacteriales bacterium]